MTTYGYLLPTRANVFASETAAELTARVDADVLGLARRAEALGYDAVWVGDSVLAKPRLEPLSTLAAVASATEAVTLGTAVYLPILRHPVHVAHTTATLDQLSGGRLALGVGVGVRPAERTEQRQLDVPFERRGALLNETLDLIAELWEGTPIDHGGKFYDVENAGIGFGPCRSPPIYVASAAVDPSKGFPATIRERLATHADGWLPIGLSPEAYTTGLDRVRAIVADADRDPDLIDPALYLDVVVADTEAAALEEAREFLAAYYAADGASYDESALSEETIAKGGAFGPLALIEQRLAEYEEAGVETFVVRFVAANQREQLHRFAGLVA